MTFEELLPYIFLFLMALSVLIYSVLDGFDLGVGILLHQTNEDYRNQMIASIGPFWDANETWLVLAIGILLIAFPEAHNIFLRELYLPVLFLIIGLIIRGIAFDFRAKAVTKYKRLWDRLFQSGSILAAASQGYMMGSYVLGFENSLNAFLFSCLSAIGVTAAYAYIGGAWLVLKTEGDLQIFAARKARIAGWITALGVLVICVTNPMIDPNIASRWFSLPGAILIVPIPLMVVLLLYATDRYLKNVPFKNDIGCWIPFASVAGIFFLCLIGLAYSYYPYVIPNKLLAVDAASSTASLKFVFYGVAIVLPIILIYTFLSYRLFKGKTTELEYY